MKKILFLWSVDDSLKEYFNKSLLSLIRSKKVDLIFLELYNNNSALKIAPEADMIIGWRPKKEILLFKKTVLFNNPGAGVKHLIPLFKEINSIRKSKLLLANCHGNAYFTAQHVVALLLTLINKVLIHHNWMKSGRWRTSDKDAISTPLRNKVIGLLGYGAINSKVHQFLSGFDVEFAILRSDWGLYKEVKLKFKKYTINRLHDFLAFIDILIVAVPLTVNTKSMIADKELEILGKDGIVVNVGRGPVIDESALYQKLKNNEIAGACIDVWYDYDPKDLENKKYPYSNTTPFHNLDNIILSPHRGASPMDDLVRWNDVLFNIETLSNNRINFKNLVNLDREY